MIGIIGALDQEVEIIKSQISEGLHSEQEKVLGSVFYHGTLFDQEVVLSQCSIGKVNAAVVATAMIMKYNPDIIINTGISGALTKNVKVMDVVVIDKVSIHDEGDVFNKYFPFTTAFEVKNKYIDKIKNIYQKIYGNLSGLHVGEVVTGDEFIDSDKRKHEIRQNFGDALTVDMECGAIAKVCFRAKTDMVSIKTISDEADDFAKVSYDNFIDLAAKKSSEIVFGFVEQFRTLI